jgi:hypothetical protein
MLTVSQVGVREQGQEQGQATLEEGTLTNEYTIVHTRVHDRICQESRFSCRGKCAQGDRRRGKEMVTEQATSQRQRRAGDI